MMTTLSIEQETFKSFFQLSKEAISKIWSTKLSGNDWKVYSFLSLIDPFGDRWCELPDIENICQLLTISQASFYRAMSKLKEAELINAEDKGWRFKNILGFAKMRGHSQNCETILKNEKPLSKMRIDSQNCENQSPEPLPELDSNLSQTIQTNKTVHTLSDCDTHIDYWSIAEKEENNQLEQYISSLNQEPKTNVLVNPPSASFNSHNLKVEKNVPAGSIVVRNQETDHEQQDINHSSFITRNSIWQWLPEGAWNVNGKLDSAFQEWLAKKWVVKYQDCDIYESKANVLAYFRNDPAKLPIRWKQYQEEYLAKVQNIKNRLDNGCTISPEQQQETIALLGALRPLDPEQSVSAQTPVEEGSGSTRGIHPALGAQRDKEESVNIYQESEVSNIYAEDQYGAKVKIKDFTGCHEKEQIPINKNAINAIAAFLQGLKGGKK